MVWSMMGTACFVVRGKAGMKVPYHKLSAFLNFAN